MAVLGPAFRAAGYLLVLAAVNLACFAVYNAICSWDLFAAESVEVTGNRRLSDAVVRSRAGVEVGDNVLAVNLQRVRRRLLAHPWVEEASVYREIPRRVRIHVRERECLAVIDLGRRFLIDPHGVPFSEAPEAAADDVPLIVGLDYTDLGLGSGPASAAFRSTLEVLEVVASGETALRMPHLSQVRVDRDSGLTLDLKPGSDRMPFGSVFLGYGSYREKLDQLARLPERLRRIGRAPACRWVSLENQNRTIVQPAGAEAS